MTLNKDNSYLLLLSGGPDSTYLFYKLLKLKLRFSVLHVNYGLRKEANLDEDFCKKLCQQNEIKLHIERYNNKSKLTSNNFQSNARNFRYLAASKIVKKNNSVILTGHTLNDDYETIIMQKQKKITPAYYGIKSKVTLNDSLVLRPLIKIKKQSILKFLKKNNLTYCLDSSNFDTKYKRNEIRMLLSKKKKSYYFFLKVFKITNNFFKLFSEKKIDNLYTKVFINNELILKNFIKLNSKYKYLLLLKWLTKNKLIVNKQKIIAIIKYIYSKNKQTIFILAINKNLNFKNGKYIIQSKHDYSKKTKNKIF